MNSVISDVALRLLNLLRSKQDTAILGEQVKRELIYRVLQAGVVILSRTFRLL